VGVVKLELTLEYLVRITDGDERCDRLTGVSKELQLEVNTTKAQFRGCNVNLRDGSM
jgi:hypothetical protein